MIQFNVTAHAVEESPIVPGRKSVTSYTLPTGASGLSEDYKLRKELGLPCTMIQQSFLLACSATSGLVRTRMSDISGCTCECGQALGGALFGTVANKAAVSFQGGIAGCAESASARGQSCVPPLNRVRGLQAGLWT